MATLHANHSRRLARKLAAYAAAGATLTALPAQAAIVHTDFGPDGVLVNDNGFNIDFDHDGIVDISLIRESIGSTFSSYYSPGRIIKKVERRSLIRGRGGNLVLANGNGEARKLPAGIHIEPSASSGHSAGVLAMKGWRTSFTAGGARTDSGSSSSGVFSACPTSSASVCAGQFLGVLFDFADQGRHVGWLQIEADSTSIRLFDFAFESTPGKSILAGDSGGSQNVPGDTNADGRVDLEDLNNVRNNFGASGDGILGDTNDDDLVDLEDLNAVRNNFGVTSGANPVPEPPSLLPLLAAGATGLAALRRKRARHERS